jgi:hypothetical protein
MRNPATSVGQQTKIKLPLLPQFKHFPPHKTANFYHFKCKLLLIRGGVFFGALCRSSRQNARHQTKSLDSQIETDGDTASALELRTDVVELISVVLTLGIFEQRLVTS